MLQWVTYTVNLCKHLTGITILLYSIFKMVITLPITLMSWCFKAQASAALQPMDKRLSQYIKQVVNEHGVTSTFKMKLLLEIFLKQSIFKDSPLPSKLNKRFWPSLKDIYNHMAAQFLKLRDSCVDQVCITLFWC